MKVEHRIVSPASEDHELSHRAALTMKTRGKQYSQFYVPNRSELCLGRFMGLKVLVDARRHVERMASKTEMNREWNHDITVGGHLIDVKAPKPTPGREPGITVTNLHPGVFLFGMRPELSSFLDESDPVRDITFTLMGWILSDPKDPAFMNMGGYYLVPGHHLRPIHEFMELLVGS